MMTTTMINSILGIILGIAFGLLISYFIQRKKIALATKKGEAQAKKIIRNARIKSDNIRDENILKAKEKFLSLKEQHNKMIADKNKEQTEKEIRIKSKEAQLSKELNKNKQWNNKLEQKLEKLNQDQKRLNTLIEEKENFIVEYSQKLEAASDMSVIDVKKELVKLYEAEAKSESMKFIQNTIEEAKLSAHQEAKKIIISTIQRIGTEEAIENCVTVFKIDSDEIKGSIIGREGRNIRALESLTGVEIIVDDTPNAVILSCFDPVRREIARLSLHHLVTDGRIHPARIEEVVKKVKKQLDNEIVETGKRTIMDLGIHGLSFELIRYVGRMRYRSSYGQNLLHHSREVARLCGSMASELGLNPQLAKRAGLLHDIGKVPENETELSHALLGMKLAEKNGEKKEVCNAIGAHHDEIEMTSLFSPLIQVCDAISGARPGARRQMVESYVQRLKDLEKKAYSFQGVEKAFAIQAGKELRVIVGSDKIKDEDVAKLSYDISQKIQSEMTYPGQVKVTVIRETRAINVAR